MMELFLLYILLSPQIIFKSRKSLHPECLTSCLIHAKKRLSCGSINVLGIYQVLYKAEIGKSNLRRKVNVSCVGKLDKIAYAEQ